MSNLEKEIAILKSQQARMELRLAELETGGPVSAPTLSEKVLYFKRMARMAPAERKSALRQWNREQEARRG